MTTKITKPMPELHVFGTLDKDKINYIQPPLSLRNDCQIGQWKIGDDNLIGNSIDISIIKVQQFFGNLGKTENTQWLQIWFVAAPTENKIPANTVCCTYLKTRSIQSLGNLNIQIMNDTDPALGIYTASFDKHSNHHGIYYSVKFSWRQRKNDTEIDQLYLIADFLKSKPLMVDSNLPPAMILMDNTTSIEDAKQAVALIKASSEKN